jgi:hypothetical protein
MLSMTGTFLKIKIALTEVLCDSLGAALHLDVLTVANQMSLLSLFLLFGHVTLWALDPLFFESKQYGVNNQNC